MTDNLKKLSKYFVEAFSCISTLKNSISKYSINEIFKKRDTSYGEIRTGGEYEGIILFDQKINDNAKTSKLITNTIPNNNLIKVGLIKVGSDDETVILFKNDLKLVIK